MTFLNRLTSMINSKFNVLAGVGGMNLGNAISRNGTFFERKGANMASKFRERVLLGHDSNGNPIVEWACAPDRLGLHLEVARKLAKHNSSMVEDNSTLRLAIKTGTNFETYAREWLALYATPKLKPTTLAQYTQLLKTPIYQFFREMTIEEIKTADISHFYRGIDDKSKSTCHTIKCILNQIFNSAIEDDIIKQNPMNSKRISYSNKVSEREPLTKKQVVQIVEDIKALKPKDRLLVMIMAYTGLRRGEIIGLRWEDIFFEEKLIRIRNNVTFVSNQPIISTPKTKGRLQPLMLSNTLATELENYEERRDKGYIFGDGEQPLTRSAYDKSLKRIKKTINLYGATAQVFRHTLPTLLAKHVDPKTMQAIMGHSNISITLNTYTHVIEEKVVEAGAIVDEALAACDPLLNPQHVDR